MRARAVVTFSRELNALMRTWPSPHLPKPAPGVQTTCAWFSSSRRIPGVAAGVDPEVGRVVAADAGHAEFGHRFADEFGVAEVKNP